MRANININLVKHSAPTPYQYVELKFITSKLINCQKSKQNSKQIKKYLNLNKKNMDNVQIGFKEDCKDLIQAFTSHNSPKFEYFDEEWKQLHFHYIFL